MAFTEKLKKEVRNKSDGRWAICHKPNVTTRGFIMVNENAVALCAYCHDIIGGNANKRKQLKELRDYWYKEVEANRKSKLIVQHYLHEKVKPIPYREPNNNKKIAIYHLVNKEENFIDAANDLFKLTRSAQIKEPNKERILYLDIEGHRKNDGGFDHDMWELQFYFILQNLFDYYIEVHLPIGSYENKLEQRNDLLPEKLDIVEEKDIPEELKPYEGAILESTIIEEIKNVEETW